MLVPICFRELCRHGKSATCEAILPALLELVLVFLLHLVPKVYHQL